MQTIRLVAIVSLIFINACVESDKKKDIHDTRKWFETNKEEIINIKDTLLNDAKNIRRLEGYTPSDNFFFVENSRLYIDLVNKVEKLNVRHVVVSRKGNLPTGILASVTFTLVAEGFVFARGKSVLVEYIPKSTFIEKMKQGGYKGEFYPLDVSGWYIVYDSG